MYEDENMKISTKVYPKLDIQFNPEYIYNKRPHVLYPTASYYKGQLQHSDHGVMSINEGLELANIIMTTISNIPWFVDIMNQGIPLSEIIGRLCTDFNTLEVLSLEKNEDDISEILHQSIFYYTEFVRYGKGENLLCYMSLKDIDSIKDELFEVIFLAVMKYREGKA